VVQEFLEAKHIGLTIRLAANNGLQGRYPLLSIRTQHA
jgi:hypothetical protein